MQIRRCCRGICHPGTRAFGGICHPGNGAFDAVCWVRSLWSLTSGFIGDLTVISEIRFRANGKSLHFADRSARDGSGRDDEQHQDMATVLYPGVGVPRLKRIVNFSV